MNRKTLTFGLFLIFSFLAWMAGKLTSTYEDTVRVNLQFNNLPVSARLPLDFQRSINIKLKADGYVFLMNKWFGATLPIDLASHIKYADDQFFVDSDDLLTQIKSVFPRNSEVIAIIEHRILINLEKIESKQIRVVSHPGNKPEAGYFFVRPLRFDPPEITITGPNQELKKWKEISADIIDFSTNANDTVYAVDLLLPKSSKLFLSIKKVRVFAEIDRFVDVSQTVYLRPLHLPENRQMLSFPNKVKVTFKIGSKSFEKYKIYVPEAVLDFNDSNPESGGYKIKINNLPDWVKSVKITPESARGFVAKLE